MTKDPKRIDRIIDLIREIWKENPYMRLSQLLGACVEDGHELYYIQDTRLERKLKDLYKE